MNKITVILIIALIAIVYLAFDKFISIDSPAITNSPNETGMGFTAIKPPTVSTKPIDLKNNSGSSFENKSDNNDLATKQQNARSQRKVDRKKLIDLYNSDNKNYDTLGNFLEKINANKGASIGTKEHIERIKHNLVISKKIAALTKELYTDVDGEKEFNNAVLDQITALQNQLILPFGLVDYIAQSKYDK